MKNISQKQFDLFDVAVNRRGELSELSLSSHALPDKKSFFCSHRRLSAVAAIAASVIGAPSMAQSSSVEQLTKVTSSHTSSQTSSHNGPTPTGTPEFTTPQTFVPIQNVGSFSVGAVDPLLGIERAARTVTVWSTNLANTYAVGPIERLVESVHQTEFIDANGELLKLPRAILAASLSDDKSTVNFTLMVELYPDDGSGGLAKDYILLAKNAVRARFPEMSEKDFANMAIERCAVSGLSARIFDRVTGEEYGTFNTKGQIETPSTLDMQISMPAARALQFIQNFNSGKVAIGYQIISEASQREVASALVIATQEATSSALAKFKVAHPDHRGLYTDNEKNEITATLHTQVREIVDSRDPVLAAKLLEHIQKFPLPNIWTPSLVVELAGLSSTQQERVHDRLKPLVDTRDTTKQRWENELKGQQDGKTTTWKVGGGGGINLGFVSLGGGGGRHVTNSDFHTLEAGTGARVIEIDHKNQIVRLGAEVSRLDDASLAEERLMGTFFVNVNDENGFMKSVIVPSSFSSISQRDVDQQREIIELKQELDAAKSALFEEHQNTVALKTDYARLSKAHDKLSKHYQNAVSDITLANSRLAAAEKNSAAFKMQRNALFTAIVKNAKPSFGQNIVSYGRLYDFAKCLKDQHLRKVLVDKFLDYWSHSKEAKNVTLPPPILPK